MATHVCFEKHKELARRHEECARTALEDALALRNRDPGGSAVGVTSGVGTTASDGDSGIGRSFSKKVQCATAQQRLAVREYREALRLRPRDPATREHYATAQATLKSLRSAFEAAQPKPLRRFLAHYNLSIRYWDLGKAREAIKEAERACDELRQAGMQCGCAEHNRVIMERVHAANKEEERRLTQAVQRSPEAIGPNYELGELYFEKRMLLRAEAQLKWTKERARAASTQQIVAHERRLSCSQELPESFSAIWASAEDRKAQRMSDILSDLDDDLRLLAGLRELWCVEEEAGKSEELQATGVRDGARPHLLPCLNRRYSQDVRACDEWWAELCELCDVGLKPSTPELSKATSPFGAASSRSGSCGACRGGRPRDLRHRPGWSPGGRACPVASR